MTESKKQATLKMVRLKARIIKMIEKNPIAFMEYRKKNPEKIINLSGAEFNNLILNGLDLRKCILIGTQFHGCSMCGMLMNYNSREIKFIECNLAGADMSRTLLRDSYFDNCNLSGANLSGADLRGAIFTESITTSIDFTAANIAYTKGLTDKNIDDWYESTLKTIIRETSDDLSDDTDDDSDDDSDNK